MSFDDLLLAIIIAGIGLSVGGLCAKYREWRRYLDAEKRQAVRFRELHAHRTHLQERDGCASRGDGQQQIVDTNPRRFQGSSLDRMLVHSCTSLTSITRSVWPSPRSFERVDIAISRRDERFNQPRMRNQEGERP